MQNKAKLAQAGVPGARWVEAWGTRRVVQTNPISRGLIMKTNSLRKRSYANWIRLCGREKQSQFPDRPGWAGGIGTNKPNFGGSPSRHRDHGGGPGFIDRHGRGRILCVLSVSVVRIRAKQTQFACLPGMPLGRYNKECWLAFVWLAACRNRNGGMAVETQRLANKEVKPRGEVSEWLIELVSKTSVLLRAPRVRIPPSPLVFSERNKMVPPRAERENSFCGFRTLRKR